MTGSHCTYEEIWPQIETSITGADIYPIASHAVAYTTRFRGKDIIKRFVHCAKLL